jgi:hypothetical protein
MYCVILFVCTGRKAQTVPYQLRFGPDRCQAEHSSGNAPLMAGKTDNYRGFVLSQLGWNVIDNI